MSRRLVVFDLETGGLDPERHPIIQVAALALDAADWSEVESFEVKVQFNSATADPEALELNSFDPETWRREAVRPEDAAASFAAFLRRHATMEKVSARTGNPYRVAELVAYNGATFDGPFLAAWYRKLSAFCPGACYEILDVLHLARWIARFSGEPPANLKLASVAEWCGVESGEQHDALADVRTTAAVARHLLGAL